MVTSDWMGTTPSQSDRKPPTSKMRVFLSGWNGSRIPFDAALPETRLDELIKLVNPKGHGRQNTGDGRTRQPGGRGKIIFHKFD